MIPTVVATAAVTAMIVAATATAVTAVRVVTAAIAATAATAVTGSNYRGSFYDIAFGYYYFLVNRTSKNDNLYFTRPNHK